MINQETQKSVQDNMFRNFYNILEILVLSLKFQRHLSIMPYRSKICWHCNAHCSSGLTQVKP